MIKPLKKNDIWCNMNNKRLYYCNGKKWIKTKYYFEDLTKLIGKLKP